MSPSATDRPRSTPGADVQRAISAILDWAGRPEVRRELLGRSGRELSVIDVTLLRVVQAEGPLRASALAERQGVDKSTITPQIRRLEQRGLVTRSPDPCDGRAALIEVTARGRRACDDMDAAGACVFDDVLRSWPMSDRRALGPLLARLADGLQGRATGGENAESAPPDGDG